MTAHNEDWLRARATEANRKRRQRVEDQARAVEQGSERAQPSSESTGSREKASSTANYQEFLHATPHSAEFVYVLKTRYIAGTVKIGRTRHPPHERAKDLNRQTGIANDHWHVAYAVGTYDSHKLEKSLHQMFAPHAHGGEVFAVPIINVVEAILKFSVVSTFDLAEVERIA
jgi:hypothetical protein